MEYNRKRIDDIMLMREELFQHIRVEGEMLAKKVNSQANKTAGYNSDDTTVFTDIVDDDVNKQKVLRQIELCIEEFGDLLYPYTKKVSRHPYAAFDNYKDPEIWHIELLVPQTLSPVSIAYIKTLGHEYVVQSVILQWMKGYFAENQISLKMAEIEDLKTKISAVKDRRTGPVRHRGGVY